jgi:hypothetical protein
VLLRQFADAREEIAVVDKYNAAQRIERVRDVSVVRNANTLQVTGGLDYSLERVLSKIENHYPRIIASLDSTVRTRDEDAWILSLITTQMARDPFNRAWIGEEAAQIYESLRCALREENTSISDDEIEDEWEYYAKGNLVKPHVGVAPANIAKAGTAWLIQAYYASLQPYCLAILRAKATKSFITADSPLSLYDRYALAGTSELTRDTSFHDETELVFPITSRHAALITLNQLKPLFDVSDDIVVVVNARTVRAAAAEIYCHPLYAADRLKRDLSMWWWRRALQPDLS